MTKKNQKKPFPLIPVAGGVVVLLALIAFFAGRGDDADPSAPGLAQIQPVELSGSSLPVFQASGADPAEGTPAPVLVGKSFDGSEVEIGPDGRAKLVIFLAHWCPHCQAEVPVIARWLEENGAPEDVDLYLVTTSTSENRPNYPPSEWLEREGLDLPTLADDAAGSAASAFGLSAFPYLTMLDGEGNVLIRNEGEFSVAELEGFLSLAGG